MNVHRFFLTTGKAVFFVLIATAPLSVMANSPEVKTAFESQQNGKISGTVKDAKTGEPLIGVSIIVSGGSQGTITDMDGNFILDVATGVPLTISYIGYKTKEVKAGLQMHLILEEDSEELEEVVVVGYGIQKKVNLSGSVASVNVEKITEGRPITNVSQALAGMAAGVQVTSGTNRPGSDEATIKVRGQGTLNSSAPLVIIDGVEAPINSVNPQDIASVSILKDAASAAIYGSRAANGVVLITTKKGESGSFKIDYNGYASFESIRKTDSMTPVSDYADYMELVNEGLKNTNMATKFSQEAIDAWRNDAGNNPLLYPNTDWIDETFRTAVSTNHILSVNGGTDKLRFYASMGYMKNPGVMENTGTERYNGRLNVEADLKSWLTLGMQVGGYISNSKVGEADDVFMYAKDTTPGMVFRAPDGRYGAMSNSEDKAQGVNNTLRKLNSKSGNSRKENIRARFLVTIQPIKDLQINASYAYEGSHQLEESKPVFIDLWDFKTNTIAVNGTGKSSVSNSYGRWERNFWDVTVNYSHRYLQDKLGLKAMVGTSSEQYQTKNFSAMKQDMIDTSLGVIDAANGEASASGNASDWAMNSYFGRINLDWANKYLLEVNLRTDGSSRFAKSNRWGWFPSFSVAWRLEQEEFMKDLVNSGLSNLKLRASYGSLGNNSIGNYESIPTYAQANYVLNNSVATGMAILALANQNLTWESTYVTNIGVDFGIVGGKLSGTLEYFHKKTKDILINLPAPDVHGIATIPTQNSAQVSNKGVEISVGWNDRISGFSYFINGNFTYVKNNVDKYKGKGVDGRTIDGTTLIWEGHPINSHYLLAVDRIIQTDKDMKLVQDMIDNAPIDEKTGKKKNPFSAFGTPEKGDLLYKDANGDGIINSDDRMIVSDGTSPKFYYGFNIGASWKGFDFSTLIQGVGGSKAFWRFNGYNTPSVKYGCTINKEIAEGRWYEGRTDATYPRLLNVSDKRNIQDSDFYLYDNGYVKIRNIQLGYTFPKSVTAPLKLDRLRIYGSLENFFTFTKYKGLDPEVSGLDYPTMREAVIGINLTF